MKRLTLSLFLVLTLLSDTFGYETNVHEQITGKAIESSNIEPFLGRNLKISFGNKFDGQFISEWLKLGSNWEDDQSAAAVVFVGRVLNHFYDPTTDEGLNAGGSSWGQPSLQWGKDYYGNQWSWKWSRTNHRIFSYFMIRSWKSRHHQTSMLGYSIWEILVIFTAFFNVYSMLLERMFQTPI